MTEAEWLTCDDPERLIYAALGNSVSSLLARLFANGSERVGQRKMRLLLCAMCRLQWDQFIYARGRNAVEVAEQFLASQATPNQLKEAHRLAMREFDGIPEDWTWWDRFLHEDSLPDLHGGNHLSYIAAAFAARSTIPRRMWHKILPEFMREFGATRSHLCILVRDIVGNPFRPSRLNPVWLTWNAGAIFKVAQSIYDDRRFSDLPVLADALEGAGCTEPAILQHCRSGDEHVRGCWVVDLLLGKK